MPGRDLFGEQNWDTFSRAKTADAYAVEPQPGGPIAGETTFASSSRRDPQAMHRIWAFLQDYKTFETSIEPSTPPVPEYLIRYGRDGRSVDLVLDVDAGFLSIYPTGEPEVAKWISVRSAIKELTEQFDQLLGRQGSRDLRPNL
jgi:hypothetical protein